MKAIVQNDIIIDPAKSWNAGYYIKKMSFYGYSVSFPIVEPVEPMIFGDIKILPVEEIRPSIDTATEEYTGPTVEVFEDKVVLTYGKQAKIPGPVEPPPEPPIVVEEATGIGDIVEQYNTLVAKMIELRLI